MANRLSYVYIDTGAMYRALTWMALKENLDIHDEAALSLLLKKIQIDLKQNDDGQIILVNHQDITEQIRSQSVTTQVSHIAKHPKVREEMVRRQQDLAKAHGVVMDGRDIGTHVLPNAELKIFLIASVEERAKRRYEENIKKGFKTDLNELRKEIEERDLMDSNRKVAPLTKAKDAIEIDTTSLSIEEVASNILAEATLLLNKKR